MLDGSVAQCDKRLINYYFVSATCLSCLLCFYFHFPFNVIDLQMNLIAAIKPQISFFFTFHSIPVTTMDAIPSHYIQFSSSLFISRAMSSIPAHCSDAEICTFGRQKYARMHEHPFASNVNKTHWSSSEKFEFEIKISPRCDFGSLLLSSLWPK